jgi:hypothetical protein
MKCAHHIGRHEDFAVTESRPGRGGLAILALPGASFFQTVQLFYSTSSVNPVLPAALECVVCDPSLTPYRREPAGAKMVST